MAIKLSGKTVMITGAAGAVAYGVVKKFAETGANLVLVDLATKRLEEIVKELDIKHYLFVSGDLGVPDEVDKMIDAAVEKFGTIDALAHIAGGFASGEPVHLTDVAVLEKMLNLNTRLTFVTLGRVAKHMVDKKVKGSLITVIARAAQTGGKNMAAYTASKAAAERIMQSMALELKEYDIRVNGISPSIVDSPANRRDMPDADTKKWVSPEQVGDLIVFLASDASSAISGQTIGIYNKV